MNHQKLMNTTTAKQSTTKPCACFNGYNALQVAVLRSFNCITRYYLLIVPLDVQVANIMHISWAAFYVLSDIISHEICTWLCFVLLCLYHLLLMVEYGQYSCSPHTKWFFTIPLWWLNWFWYWLGTKLLCKPWFWYWLGTKLLCKPEMKQFLVYWLFIVGAIYYLTYCQHWSFF